MVPSWTETLIEAGVNVVGRTRFCIHPEDKVENIPVVGGTKYVDWLKVKKIKPDLVIFDREENLVEMAHACPYPWYASHVQSIHDMPEQIQRLSYKLDSPGLGVMAENWEKLLKMIPPILPSHSPPGLIEWKKPIQDSVKRIVYVIWKDPWMAAGPDTFIGSAYEWLGWKLWGFSKYPTFTLEDIKSQYTFFLCSSEPYPFLKKKDSTLELPGAVAIVDGEKLSWFGIRSYRYLSSLVFPPQ